jgi:MtN3 and saliva related transmembrane protein
MRTLRTHETHGISLWMYVLFTIGVGCWLAYGLLLGSWPMIFANVVTLGLAMAILLLKLRYG